MEALHQKQWEIIHQQENINNEEAVVVIPAARLESAAVRGLAFTEIEN